MVDFASINQERKNRAALPSGPLVGFTGPRALPAIFQPAVRAIVQTIAKQRQIVVGCAQGADRFVRIAACEGYQENLFVFAVDERCQLCDGQGRTWAAHAPAEECARQMCPDCHGSGCLYGCKPAALARRSQAMVKAIVDSGKGRALIGFPDRFCPPNIKPSQTWIGGSPKSGTWSTLAMAAGSGVPAFILACESTRDGMAEKDGLLDRMCPKFWPGQWVQAGKKAPWSWLWKFEPQSPEE